MMLASSVDVAVRNEIADFLYGEAELLDDCRFDDWLSLIHDAIHYIIPVRVTVLRGEGSDQDRFAHIDDYYPALEARVHRMMSPYNWAENPASRTRRHVSNIRVSIADAATGTSEQFSVRSNLLFYRSRSDDHHSDIISCERHDVIVRSQESLQLRARRVVLDQSVIGTHNISFIL
jgi:PAH dioxygenase small subunit